MTTVTLYTKPDCCLCDDAKAALERVRARRAFMLEEVDVSRAPDLLDRYGERIPLVAVEGEEAFEHHVDEGRLEALLAATAPAPA